MTHITELQFSMWADSAISGDELAVLEQHAGNCEVCRARHQACLGERQRLVSALVDEPASERQLVVPTFRRPPTLRAFALANVVTGLLVWLLQFVWKTLLGEFFTDLIISAFSWLAFPLPDVYEILFDGALFYLQEGTTMVDAYIGYVGIVLAISALIWFALARGRGRLKLAVGALALCSIGLVQPTPVMALEIQRKGSIVSVPSGTTLDDTLIAVGKTVVVDGEVTGDLIAFAKRIVVNGSIRGNVMLFAESVTVRGEVGGTGIAGGERVELENLAISGDFWGTGEAIVIGGNTVVGGNATLMTEKAVLEGEVGRDLTALAESVEITGSVGRKVHALSKHLSLLGDAYVGGDVIFRGKQKSLHRSDSAEVAGEVRVVSRLEEFAPRNPYLSGKYYLWQLSRLVSAFIAGVIILWLFPGLRDVMIEGAIGGLKTAGTGIATLVSVPVVMLLLAFTLVGIPAAIIGLTVWLLLIYLAKIVLAALIGQLVFAGSAYEYNLPLTLFVGLLVIILAVNIPAIGGVISFICLVVGVGLIVQALVEYIRRLEPEN